MNTRLPEPSADARAASAALCELIAADIAAAGGWIPFSRYMELALYAPGLGYYSGGSQKFGAAGDFITAPELTPLFAHTLAVQAAQVMANSAPQILEVGAGRGILAAELLLELERTCSLPEHYLILELSGELRARQHETLFQMAPHLAPRVAWLDALPATFAGLVLGNEVLDAMPVALIEWCEDGAAEEILQRGVALDERGNFAWAARPVQGELLQAAQLLASEVPIAAPYVSEIGLAARAWLGEWGRILERGALLLIDYGFPRAEYYFPQRSSGTLMCHYRHHAHGDPLWWPGLNDITAHVDFTAIAEAGFEAGLEVLGYTGQAQFLLNCGITGILGRLPDQTGKAFLAQSRAVGKLISPNEMGELFKVIALGRGLKQPLLGFSRGDRLHAL
ncbi:MAG: SAM-dependent methyltransferase [Proteobacteria bacterium]|nr:SAM-dependent methyltransferase [Pseudomonadota bacterium]